jgi:EamA-like transporter family.
MEKVKSYMEKAKSYIELHLNILVFSLTSIFSKLAAMEYDENGLHSKFLYLFILLMILNCAFYALVWQKVIKKFSLSTAYAHKSVYLIWSQVWAVLIFHENLSVFNIIGMLIVFCGVLVVQRYE